MNLFKKCVGQLHPCLASRILSVVTVQCSTRLPAEGRDVTALIIPILFVCTPRRCLGPSDASFRKLYNVTDHEVEVVKIVESSTSAWDRALTPVERVLFSKAVSSTLDPEERRVSEVALTDVFLNAAG